MLNTSLIPLTYPVMACVCNPRPPLAPGQPVDLLLATEPACVIKARVDWVGNADPTRYG